MTTHTGHTFDVCLPPIPDDIKAPVTMQLKDGVSVTRIMDNIRDASMKEPATYQHLIVRQDINNVKRSLNLQNMHKHTNDSTSTALWVAELRAADYNPILAYKPQGKYVDEIDDIPKECFLLRIQTEL